MRRQPRLVVDTNVLVSAFLWQGTPGQLIATTGLTANQMLRDYRRLATLVASSKLARQVSRDADDDAVLACALAARADLVVSGDDDLLVLKTFEGIPIVNATLAIKRFTSAS